VGCIALLRRLKDVKPKRTVKVIFFDGEEPGALNGLCIGSSHFVKIEYVTFVAA